MERFFKDLIVYLLEVLVKTWYGVLTVFDAWGLLITFNPKLAESLTDDILLARTVGLFIFTSSFTLANFLVYRKLAEQISVQADLRLSVLGNDFGYARARPSPFPEVQKSREGFNEQGLPDWGTLWATIKIENIGHETGQLDYELDSDKTKLPSLLNIGEKPKTEWTRPIGDIAGRKSYRRQLLFDVMFTEQDPHAFAQSLGNLVRVRKSITSRILTHFPNKIQDLANLQTLRSKRQYRVVLHYKTIRVGGESETRELCITGDFQNFYQEVLKYWDDYGFHDLADTARNAAD